MMSQFTSGGTKGYELDFEKYDIPNGSNVLGTINRKNSKLEIAEKFHSTGWSVRKSSWTDFEIEGKWGEISVFGEAEVLINCVVDEKHFDDLIKIFTDFSIGFSVELYDKNDELIKMVTNNT